MNKIKPKVNILMRLFSIAKTDVTSLIKVNSSLNEKFTPFVRRISRTNEDSLLSNVTFVGDLKNSLNFRLLYRIYSCIPHFHEKEKYQFKRK